jgi:hypothetical protein
LDFSYLSSFSGRWDLFGTSEKIQNIVGIIVNPSMTVTANFDFKYNKMDRKALVTLFNSLPTVNNGIVIDITGNRGAADLTASDIQIATDKGWTVTR